MEIQKYDSVDNIDKMSIKVSEIVGASSLDIIHLKEAFTSKLTLSKFDENHLKDLFLLIWDSTPEN